MLTTPRLWYILRHRKDYQLIYAESLHIAKTLLCLRIGSDGYHKFICTQPTKKLAKRFIFWNRKTLKRIWTQKEPNE